MERNKRLPSGTLKPISTAAGISTQYLSDIAATRKRPGREVALRLEAAAKQHGKKIPAALWIFGTKEQLRSAVAGNA